jgi:hypothetical protein
MSHAEQDLIQCDFRNDGYAPRLVACTCAARKGFRGPEHSTDGEAVFIPVSEPDGAWIDWGYAPDPAALNVSRRTPGEGVG